MRARRAKRDRRLDRLVSLLGSRTHPISAAIVADLARGEGPEPLHELAIELLDWWRAGPSGTTIARVAAIGQHSGRDLLTGFLAGVIGLSGAWSVGGAGKSLESERADRATQAV